ncbi:mitochondrial carrier domain-containing protein [Zopfochytrium polystomum]|nr:mitochondrial carrier domain-containing protein [Zopfochytrium polystomum]
MSSKSAAPAAKPKRSLAIHLLAGGVAGCCEALTCHPLDTIKVRLQLRSGKVIKNLTGAAAKAPKQGFIGVGMQIVQKEGFFALYKGLGAVVSGIVPKMAIRFSSFEFYKELLADKETKKTSSGGVFIAGLGAGVTEAVLVVTPMDVIKIRLQAQRHSMSDPLDIPKYRNAPHCAYVMVKEEGLSSLYKGVTLTALRQATNQAANFTVYQFLKRELHALQPEVGETLPAYQHLVMGFISGACGPLFNAPIDTIKTRIQKTPSTERGWTRFVKVTGDIYKNEGVTAFYKGLVPRVLRVAPGQAITFMVYERVYVWMVDLSKRISVSETESVAVSGEVVGKNEA